MFTRGCWPWLFPTSKSTGSTSLSGGSGAAPGQLRLLASWLLEQEVKEVVMESTAQYWKPVWEALERYWKPLCPKREDTGLRLGAMHLAQAQSNRGPRGRKDDFADA